jgi:hypothetical protein
MRVGVKVLRTRLARILIMVMLVAKIRIVGGIARTEIKRMMSPILPVVVVITQMVNEAEFNRTNHRVLVRSS